MRNSIESKPKRKLSGFFKTFNQKKEVREKEDFVSIYNAKVDRILRNKKLQDDFETILDEQKAILIDRGLSETEAEIQITNPDNLREIVLSL